MGMVYGKKYVFVAFAESFSCEIWEIMQRLWKYMSIMLYIKCYFYVRVIGGKENHLGCILQRILTLILSQLSLISITKS